MAQKRALEEQASTPRADVLKAASDAGFLKMDPQRALAFLAEFQRLGKNPGARALLSLCDGMERAASLVSWDSLWT